MTFSILCFIVAGILLYFLVTSSDAISKKTHKFNTIVSSVMECYNAISKQTNPEIWEEGYMTIIDIFSPICPHICSEIEDFIKNH